jgi:hypothetical protein
VGWGGGLLRRGCRVGEWVGVKKAFETSPLVCVVVPGGGGHMPGGWVSADRPETIAGTVSHEMRIPNAQWV